MKKYFTPGILKWIAEGLLIVFSVLLAFYVENKRQEWNEQKTLITNLKELRQSITDDTLVFRNVVDFYVYPEDTLYRETLNLIKEKERVHYILQCLSGHQPVNYRNWTLNRMLEGNDLRDVDKSLLNGLWEYNSILENIFQGNIQLINENNNKALTLVFSGITYGDDYSKLAGLGDDQPLIRYRQYRDSSIVYSEQLKSLVVHNLVALQSLRFELLNHKEHALPVLKAIDEQIVKLD